MKRQFLQSAMFRIVSVVVAVLWSMPLWADDGYEPEKLKPEVPFKGIAIALVMLAGIVYMSLRGTRRSHLEDK